MSGPLMVDLAGTNLADGERVVLRDKRVGGLILFKRNFSDVTQLKSLVREVRQTRSDLLIAVDHEGGRVQRFREGFTRLPSMRALGDRYLTSPGAAIRETQAVGYVLARELRDCDIDLSFAPVLDLDWGKSTVVGDRSFSVKPEVVTTLAAALISGMKRAGMACCGKHFPGHGWVEADSHIAIPVDTRSLDEIQTDLVPFRAVPLDAVMPAHVSYPAVDSRPAGFSPWWHTYLREDVGFDGAVFSDDLSMEGASVVGGVVERVEAAWQAGCDMLLLCNAPDQVERVLAQWTPSSRPASASRIQRLLGRAGIGAEANNSVLLQWGKDCCQRLTAPQ